MIHYNYRFLLHGFRVWDFIALFTSCLGMLSNPARSAAPAHRSLPVDQWDERAEQPAAKGRGLYASNTEINGERGGEFALKVFIP